MTTPTQNQGQKPGQNQKPQDPQNQARKDDMHRSVARRGPRQLQIGAGAWPGVRSSQSERGRT